MSIHYFKHTFFVIVKIMLTNYLISQKCSTEKADNKEMAIYIEHHVSQFI